MPPDDIKGSEPQDLPPEPEYVSEVEARIAELRGIPLVLSTRDWELVRGWRSQGIPLAVVLRALEDVLAQSGKRDEPGHPPRSLAYCERAVQQRWKARKESWVGRPAASTVPPRRLRATLNALAREMTAAAGRLRTGPKAGMATPLRETAATLRRLARSCARSAAAFGDLAPELRNAERALEQGLRAAAAPHWTRLRERERTILRSRLSCMSAEAAESTLDAAVFRRLRQDLGIPVFDLGAIHARLQAGGARRGLTSRRDSV